MKNNRKAIICAAAAVLTLAAAVPAASFAAEGDSWGVVGDWYTDDDGRIYYFDETGRALTGEQTIDGVPYLFSSNGVLKTGWRTVGGKRRYYDHETGEPVYGWMTYCGKEYYLAPDEGKATGAVKTDEGELVLFGEKGDTVQGQGFTEYDGSIYYIKEDGVLAEGEYSVDDMPYFFDEAGAEQTGWVNVSSGTYYYDPDTGLVQTGFITVDGDGYYVDTQEGLKTGVTEINGIPYMLDESTGRLNTGLIDIDGSVRLYYTDGTYAVGVTEYGGGTRLFGENGAMVTGLVRFGSDFYYADENGVLCTGWQTVNGSRYYFDESTFTAKTGFTEFADGDNTYTVLFLADGVMAEGFTDYQNSRYYFAPGSGAMASGNVTIDGKNYCFAADGKMKTGWQTIDSKKYYFDKTTGAMCFGITEIDGKKYYFDVKTGVMTTGKLVIDKKKYYFEPTSGVMQTGWVTIDSSKYYFAADGEMQTGWVTISGKKYYFNPSDGKMMTNTIVGDYNLAADGHAIAFSAVQKRANTILASTGKTAGAIYNYVVSHNYYKFIESTKSLAQIESIGWSYFANYALDKPAVVCYYFAAVTDLLFQQAGYTTRIVYGTGRGSGDHYWNQVYVDGKWLNYDTCNGYNGVSFTTLQNANYTIYQYVNAKFYSE